MSSPPMIRKYMKHKQAFFFVYWNRFAINCRFASSSGLHFEGLTWQDNILAAGKLEKGSRLSRAGFTYEELSWLKNSRRELSSYLSRISSSCGT